MIIGFVQAEVVWWQHYAESLIDGGNSNDVDVLRHLTQEVD